MSTTFTLQHPGRPIRVGVLLLTSWVIDKTSPLISSLTSNRTTELLDVAPVDYFHALDKKFLRSFPDSLFSPDEKAAGLDFEFHWVAEKNKAPCKLTSGGQLVPTVRNHLLAGVSIN